MSQFFANCHVSVVKQASYVGYYIPVSQLDSLNSSGCSRRVKYSCQVILINDSVTILFYPIPIPTADTGRSIRGGNGNNHGQESGRVEKNGIELKGARKLLRNGGGGENHCGFTELEQVSQLGRSGERVGGGDSHAEGEQGEVKNRDVEGRRGKDENNVVFREGRELGLEGDGQGVGLAEEAGVGELVSCGGVDEKRSGECDGGSRGGHGCMEEGKRVFRHRNWLRNRR